MVRKAQKEELSQINSIRRQVSLLHASARPDMFKEGFSAQQAELVYGYLEDETSLLLVNVREERVLGYACAEIRIRLDSVFRPQRKTLYIHELGVDQSARRTGAGRELIEFLSAYARELRFDAVELDMWEFNQDALQFYQNMGFSTARRYMELRLENGESEPARPLPQGGGKKNPPEDG